MKSFSDQIKQLSSVTKTLKDSNSDINDMSDALKHFIMTFDHKTINSDSKVFTSMNDLSNNFIDLSNYMSNFSEIEPMLSKYTESQSFYNAEARKAHIDAVALNDKKLSEISIEIESIKNHIKELRTNSTPVDTEINDQEGNPFSINKAGNRVINKSSDLHENPTSYIKAHQESCISEDLKTSLMSYLSENFEKDTEEGKQIAIYGQNMRYLNSKKESKKTEIPTVVKDIIREMDAGNDRKINSVVITRHSDELPPIDNSFTNKCITPESDISIISIGGTFDILFRDKIAGDEKLLKTDDTSCFVMSQQSQFYWSHRVTCHPKSPEYPQYTISLLFTGLNHNSTLIIRDSNTFNIKFHNEKSYYSNLGKEINGKRYICYLIEDVDPLKCLGYQNIIFHVGINNLKDRYHGIQRTRDQVDFDSVFDSWLTTVAKLHNLCP